LTFGRNSVFSLIAIGLSHFSITGAFMGPLTMPHLLVNALTSSGAVVGVCPLPIVGLLLLSHKNGKTILFGRQFSFIRSIVSLQADFVKQKMDILTINALWHKTPLKLFHHVFMRLT
jgi:hypothetical protein